ncbi:MAG: serine protease [Pirellulaceae bacterium]|nr:serine protease [Pirellulaceae bacterium]
MSSAETNSLRGHEEVSNVDLAQGMPEVDQVVACCYGQQGGEAARRSGVEPVPGYQGVNVERMKQRYQEHLVEVVGLPEEDVLCEASVGTFGRNYVDETVIGEDDRIQILATTAAPWRWICSLLVTARNGRRFIGTGWFISPRTLMTAGHVVFMHNEGGWAREVTVIPGRNGTDRPLGSQVSSSFRSVRGWTQDQDTNFDYAAIIMPDTSLGGQVGHFGFAALTDATLQQVTANLSGYPGDKPQGTQWFHARGTSQLSPQKIFYEIDTFGGQSGSPIWRLENGQRTAVAIHTSGGGGARPNSGTRINQTVFDNMQRWANP